jgi:hypothetical protein
MNMHPIRKYGLLVVKNDLILLVLDFSAGKSEFTLSKDRAINPLKESSAAIANILIRRELFAMLSNQAICDKYLETNTARYAPTSTKITPIILIFFRYTKSTLSFGSNDRLKTNAQTIMFNKLIITITVHQGQAQSV